MTKRVVAAYTVAVAVVAMGVFAFCVLFARVGIWLAETAGYANIGQGIMCTACAGLAAMIVGSSALVIINRDDDGDL